MTGRAAAWAQLLRVSAVFTVPGDALAGAAAAGHRPNRGTVLAAGASLCLYEAGMALNDWADRDIDAVERPDRPLPSGRIGPPAALAAAGALTAAGLGLAAAAGRPALATATALAGTVWAYDLGLKHTAAGPPAMAAARSLDLLLGATATGARAARHARTGTGYRSAGLRAVTGAGGDGTRLRAGARPIGMAPAARGRPEQTGTQPPAGGRAMAAAALLGAHTLAVTTVSRREATGGSSAVPLGALAAVTAVAAATVRRRGGRASLPPFPAAGLARPARAPRSYGRGPARSVRRTADTVTGAPRPSAAGRRADAVPVALAAAYAVTAARPLAHAVLNPSPQLLQRAVGGGIRAMIPLQAALAARSGAPRTALPLLALLPLARRLSRKVSPT